MNTVPEDVKDILVTNLIGYYIGDSPQNPNSLDWAISLYGSPETPIKVITLSDIGGNVISRSMNKRQIPSEIFQIMVRSEAYEDGKDKLDEIIVLLNGLGKTTVAGQSYRYQGWFQETTAIPSGKDKNQNFITTVNYRTIRVI